MFLTRSPWLVMFHVSDQVPMTGHVSCFWPAPRDWSCFISCFWPTPHDCSCSMFLTSSRDWSEEEHQMVVAVSRIITRWVKSISLVSHCHITNLKQLEIKLDMKCFNNLLSFDKCLLFQSTGYHGKNGPKETFGTRSQVFKFIWKIESQQIRTD